MNDAYSETIEKVITALEEGLKHPSLGQGPETDILRGIGYRVGDILFRHDQDTYDNHEDTLNHIGNAHIEPEIS